MVPLGTRLFTPSAWTGHQPDPLTLLSDSFRENMLPPHTARKVVLLSLSLESLLCISLES